MTEHRLTHRSQVSYIDKSREYYAAQGYQKAYEWAAHDDAPFTPLVKPLPQCKIGVITTAYFLPENFVYRLPTDLPRMPYVADRAKTTQLENKHLSWAKDETHTSDRNSYLPLERMDEFVQAGRLGAVSNRFYGLPTQFSHRQTLQRDTPRVIGWMKEDDIDVAILVPF